MRQRHERVVVDRHAGAARIELGVDVRAGPNSSERLIDQVAAEVEQQPAGLLRPRRASASRPSPPDASARSATRTARLRPRRPRPATAAGSGSRRPSAGSGTRSAGCRARAPHQPDACASAGGRGDRLVDYDREAGSDRGQTRAARGCGSAWRRPRGRRRRRLPERVGVGQQPRVRVRRGGLGTARRDPR